ncbi:MAG TPA: NAD(P)-dependent oxidoreductase [Acidimicrobiia bacterium]|nr:NAD(P)-dependent oxidoreductase [Acidimicrobiia bacterium]
MSSVGFVGIGIMGRGMSANLIKVGFDVVVWNRTASKAAAIEGGTVADSPRDVAERCDVVLICVSDSPDVVDVVRRDDGILAGLRPGALVVDHSTISPSVTRSLAADVEAAGGSWVDAPVSGGSEGAANGMLSIMVGGSGDDVARALPYFQAMGNTITHVGPVGSGQLVKIVNQMLVVINQLAVSESLLLAEAAGLDLEATLSAVTGGAAGSWMLSNRGPQMIARDWRPGFTIDLQLKDLRLVLEAADELGVPALGTSLAFHLYRTLQQQGLGGDGNHALVKALEQMTGIEVGRQR